MTLSESFIDAYSPPENNKWTGRHEPSLKDAYWYQTVEQIDLKNNHLDWSVYNNHSTVIIGYKCDEGVQRNQGRIGAVNGPDSIRNMLGSLPNHDQNVIDAGDIRCIEKDMEKAQSALAETVHFLLEKSLFPVVIGGGHDIAYGHYNGIRNYLNRTSPEASIGIINLDAHFDLRSNENENNSGTPFYQIAEDCKSSGYDFHYLCLGIQKASNTKKLFETAHSLGVEYLLNHEYHMSNVGAILSTIKSFINKVDYVYLTIDLDGFSSAYAPGVSAPSPLGFAPDIALKSIETIISSGKLVSADLAEMNPEYDIDNHTSRLASKLIHALTMSKR